MCRNYVSFLDFLRHIFFFVSQVHKPLFESSDYFVWQKNMLILTLINTSILLNLKCMYYSNIFMTQFNPVHINCFFR